jgi:hypothetical protein
VFGIDIDNNTSVKIINNEKNRFLDEIIMGNAQILLLHNKDYFILEDIIKVLLQNNYKFKTVDEL